MINISDHIIGGFQTALAIIIAYFIMRLIKKDKRELIDKVFKIGSILYIAAFIFSLITALYILNGQKPLKPVLAFVKNDPTMATKVGEIKGYSFNENEFPNKSQNSGKFKLSITGANGSLSMECLVIKDKDGEWKLTKVFNVQDIEEKE